MSSECKVLFVIALAAVTVVPSLGNVFKESCNASSCVNGAPSYCFCDPSCDVYGDCCHDANVTTKPLFNSKFSCVSVGHYTMRVWSIATCSHLWMTKQAADGVANVNDIVSSCEDPSVRASYRFLPPVTDKKTEAVYRNHFCAHCNGLQLSDVAMWRIQYVCENPSKVNTQRNLTTSDLENFCDFNVYKPPMSFPKPRGCPVLPRGLISTCPESVSVDLQEQCTLGGLNVKKRTISDEKSFYANEYCASCHNVKGYCNPPEGGGGVDPPDNLAMLLDIHDTGVVATSSTMTVNIVEEVCLSGSVYDVFKGSCRTLPSANCSDSTAITLERGSYSLIGNNNVFWISYNLNVSIESVDANGRPLVCIPSIHTDLATKGATCVPIILDRTDFEQQDNSSGTLLLLPSNESYVIEGYDAEGRPLICTNFSQTKNRTTSSNLYKYPLAFRILTYIGFSVDFVSGSVFLLTFVLFRELRTFFSKLMVNFMASILLGDIVFLLGVPLFSYLYAPPLCTTVGIILHYVFLCRFSWMTVMGFELVRSFYKMKKMKKNTGNWKLLSLYILVGWLSPLVIVIPTVIVNFTVDNSVNYGGGGNRCWINGAVALILTFVVPVGVSIVYNTIAFIVVIIVIAYIRNQPMLSSTHPKEVARTQLYKDVRFAFAVFTLTGLSWLFGFLALLSRDLSWAWYFFIILSSTQALAVSIAFLFTKKVFRLYYYLLCCMRNEASDHECCQYSNMLQI